MIESEKIVKKTSAVQGNAIIVKIEKGRKYGLASLTAVELVNGQSFLRMPCEE